MTDQWLSIVEYARTYNVSDMTVRRRIKTGRLHAVLREGKYFIPVSKESEVAINKPIISEPVVQEQRGVGSSLAPTARMTLPRVKEKTQDLVAEIYPEPTLSPNDVFSYQPTVTPQSIKNHAPKEMSKLISFCDTAVKRLGEVESILEQTYQSRIDALEARISMLEESTRSKEQQIKTLKQDNEDLNLLIKILEEEPHPHNHKNDESP